MDTKNDSIHRGTNCAAQFIFLRPAPNAIQSRPMKFALAIFTYLAMAAIIGAGILLLVAGKPLLLIIALIAFVVAFGKLGCMTH